MVYRVLEEEGFLICTAILKNIEKCPNDSCVYSDLIYNI